MSSFWIMVGISLGLLLIGLVGGLLLRLYSGLDSDRNEQAFTRERDAMPTNESGDDWEWFGYEELARRTGLSSKEHVPLSIEKEGIPEKPDWIRLHLSVSRAERELIRRAVGEGLKRLDRDLKGGEVRVYTDGKWVGSGAMIRDEQATAWIEGLTQEAREAAIRQVRNTGTAAYGVKKTVSQSQGISE